MKFLHTADWHLGLKTNGRDRLEEQRKTLDEIISIVNYENIDCIIIAGDVFNTSSPSAEAEELFFETIEKLSDNGDRFVFVLSGNHDDPTRLTAGLPLAGKHNIALVGGLDKLNEKSFNKNAIVKVIETGKGYLKIQKNEEIATISYLPYPSENRILEKVDSSLSYAEKVGAWAEISSRGFSDDSVNIFVSHLFMVGSKTSDGEVKVGQIMAVPEDMLPESDYIALGHIHTAQKLGANTYYSGAITKVNIKQKQVSVNIFETESGKVIEIRKVDLKNAARYEKLVVDSLEDAAEKLLDYDDSDLVELELHQNSPLSASELKKLKKDFPCILSIALVKSNFASDNYVQKRDKSISDEELFINFYKSVRGFESSAELLKLYIECKGGENETN